MPPRKARRLSLPSNSLAQLHFWGHRMKMCGGPFQILHEYNASLHVQMIKAVLPYRIVFLRLPGVTLSDIFRVEFINANKMQKHANICFQTARFAVY